jgi:hypothetical protein
LVFSLIFILKLKWQYVALGAIATAASAFLTTSPLVPMVVGIAALSIITLTDKKHDENQEWTISAWDFTKQIMPLLAIGVVTAGFLLGSTHDDTAMAGINGCRNGKRPRIGLIAGRTFIIITQYVGNSRRYGYAKNFSLHRTCGGNGYYFRVDFWYLLLRQ